MAGETVITVVGNLTADPELRYTQNGLAVANFTIASTPRTFDRQANEWKDGDALFLRASVWREFAEHVAGSLTKGSRVIAQGRLRQRSYQDREGQQRTSIELEATNDAMVWVDESEVAARAACPSSGAFDTAFAAARKARGHARTIEIAIANREVFACRLARAPGELASSDTLLVSTIDPVAWCRKR